jgi:hypothetical protein
MFGTVHAPADFETLSLAPSTDAMAMHADPPFSSLRSNLAFSNLHNNRIITPTVTHLFHPASVAPTPGPALRVLIDAAKLPTAI